MNDVYLEDLNVVDAEWEASPSGVDNRGKLGTENLNEGEVHQAEMTGDIPYDDAFQTTETAQGLDSKHGIPRTCR